MYRFFRFLSRLKSLICKLNQILIRRVLPFCCRLTIQDSNHLMRKARDKETPSTILQFRSAHCSTSCHTRLIRRFWLKQCVSLASKNSCSCSTHLQEYHKVPMGWITAGKALSPTTPLQKFRIILEISPS